MENSTLSDLIEKYKLPKEEHNEILEQLKTSLFPNENTTKTPSIMLVIGQPGSGKTTFIEQSNLSKYNIINSDNYRSFNKYSEEILSKYPTYYTKLTNYDVHLWGDELMSYAMQNGYSLLREKAPIDYSSIEFIKTIPKNYEIIINVVVQGNLESLLRTRERYEKEIEINNHAKLSNIESHNICYDVLPNLILKMSSLNTKVNYIVNNNDRYDIIHVEDNVLELLQKLRKESNKKAVSNFKIRIENIKNAMLNRKAPKEQFDELNKIESIYFEIVKNDKKESERVL